MRVGERQTKLTKISALMLALLLGFASPVRCLAYAVLAHEAIIDSAWNESIRPLLLKRFPGATPEALKQAHAYAYGGAIIQDVGYYPHGSKFVSNLTHYVRSGDFILALLRDAKDLNGYAFALGALSHYAADNQGHSIGVNRAVPVLYPKLGKKYGNVVTYEQDPLAHVKTEFGFDVLEVARGRYAPQNYHDFIGFEIATPLLEQAFEETYGLELKNVLDNEAKALGSYRHDVSQILPRATRVAWTLKKDEIMHDEPSITKKKFLYNLSRASYQKSWGKDYQKPKCADKFLAFLWKLVPKFGPLKVLELRTPTPETERMFESSFNASLEQYRKLLGEVGAGHLTLPNDNFDTGSATAPGKYYLDDVTQAKLVDALAKQNFQTASPQLRAELLTSFGHPDAPYATRKKPKEWAKLQAQLQQLRQAPPPER